MLLNAQGNSKERLSSLFETQTSQVWEGEHWVTPRTAQIVANLKMESTEQVLVLT